MIKWLRRLLAPVVSIIAAVGALLAGAPPAIVGVTAAVMGQALDRLLPDAPDRDDLADDELRQQRAQAYDDFGRAFGIMWNAAGILLTFRPKPLGYVHGLAALVRAQKRFEKQGAAFNGALSGCLLYGSKETQEAAVDVFRAAGERFQELAASGRQGSPSVKAAYEAASVEVGQKVVRWRQSAQADLALRRPT